MSRVTVLVVLVVAVLLAACSSQESPVVTEDQVPTPVAQAGQASATGASPGAEGRPVAATVEFTAVEFAFRGLPDSTSAGNVEFVMSNEGQIAHNMNIDELGDRKIVADTSAGEQASGTAALQAGETVTLYCSIAGHRAQGMEATLSVE